MDRYVAEAAEILAALARDLAPDLAPAVRTASREAFVIRALGEQAMATLKTWRLLRKLRCSTIRITALVRAVLALRLNALNRGRARLIGTFLLY
ncbi:hypothetical protein ACFWA5_30945 [Streptomyces mirabilis]|uniref:hypothetical protein n=1 Tax=Streptomyces mirabilis TaxID=68239 RepID=UPI00365853CC